jgi:phage/plasmid-like protein (TIGR03299 family)
MAHAFVDKGKDTSFFTVKEPAWHGLGKVLDKCPTSEEAIKLAKLDYEVKLAKIYAEIAGSHKEVEDKYATYRTDTNHIFGVVGSKYEVVQNQHAFDFFDAIVGEGEAIYETAGALGHGETIFVTAKLPSYIRVGNKDDIEKYLLFTSTHDGTRSIQAMFTPVRVVCNNTLQAALSGKGTRVSIRHTRSAQDNLKEAHKILGITNRLSDELGEIFNAMSKVQLDTKALKEYVDLIFLSKEELQTLAKGDLRKDIISTRKENIISDVLKYAEVGVGQQTETAKGTLFGAYNAVTGYYQNGKSYSNSNDKAESLLLGAAYGTGQKAFDLAYNILSKN